MVRQLTDRDGQRDRRISRRQMDGRMNVWREVLRKAERWMDKHMETDTTDRQADRHRLSDG